MPLKIRSFLHVLFVIALASSLLSLTSTPTQAAPPPTPTCAQGGPCVVGDIGPGGGKVFYVSSGRFTQAEATGSMCTTNCVYLEVAPSGWSGSSDPDLPWAAGVGRDVAGINNDGTAYNNALGIGLGFKNSNAIINEFGSSNAAGSARAYRGASKTDWYLPTTVELNLLCQWARGVASSETTRCTGGTLNSATYGADSAAFLGGNYWSSSERDVNDGRIQDMNGGAQGTGPKSFLTYVRPIRAFAPTGLVITRASVGTQRRAAFTTQPQITVKTFDNDTVTSSSAVITATISTGGTLIGTTTASVSSGTATFSNLGVDGTVGSTYTISYSTPGFIPISATITIAGTNCDGATFTCQLGDTGPGGGLIFYVALEAFEQAGATGSMCRTKCKYLEVAPSGWNGGSDPMKLWAIASLQSTDVAAITDDATVYNNSLGIGLGFKNSLAIVNQGNDATTAAGAVRAYTGGSKGDWYLPTTAELNLLCQWVRGVVQSVSTTCTGGSLNSSTYGAGSAGFSTNYYWSSSENLSQYGYVQQFASGFQINDFKSLSFDVRPIRAIGESSIIYVEPTPVSYLRTLTTPRLNVKDGKLVCTPGTYQAGYSVNGVAQGNSNALFTPGVVTYNLLNSGIANTALTLTSSTGSATWTLAQATSKSLVTCSVTVTANGVTNTDRSSDNAAGISTASVTQGNSLATANSDYSAALNANSKAYQKALVDNRANWRSETEKIRTDYYAERIKISSAPSTKATRALTSAALKAYTAAVKKSAADYKASQPAALAVREAANTAALTTRDTAIAKANSTYGTAIELIGYGVLIP